MSNRAPLEILRTSVLSTLVLSLALLGAGCAAVNGGQKSPSNPPSGPSAITSGHAVKAVSVSLDEAQLGPDVVASAQQFTVAGRLERRLKAQVPSTGTRDITVDVRVIGMRLRSTGTAIWWGFFAGKDRLVVDVIVKRGTKEVKRFETGVGTALGGFVYGGRELRVDRMVNELANRIVRGI